MDKVFGNCINIFIFFSFSWQKVSTEDNPTTFVGVAKQNVWKIWRQNDCQIAFRKLATFEENSCASSNIEILEDYFQVSFLKNFLSFLLIF